MTASTVDEHESDRVSWEDGEEDTARAGWTGPDRPQATVRCSPVSADGNVGKYSELRLDGGKESCRPSFLPTGDIRPLSARVAAGSTDDLVRV